MYENMLIKGNIRISIPNEYIYLVTYHFFCLVLVFANCEIL